jgi:FHA domain
LGEKETNQERRIAELEKGLDEALAKLRKAETGLADQAARIKTLGRGREETLLELNDTRAKLERALAQRDTLQGTADAVERMQTETIALPESADDSRHEEALLPSIDELMASLSITEDGRENAVTSAQRAEEPTSIDDSQIMLAPELMAPEEFAERDTHAASDALEAAAAEVSAEASAAGALLVFLNGDQPIRYPLYKELMTIGRSDVADIRIDGEFISREHARIVAKGDRVSIEDAGSKNGIKVNKKLVKRQALQHGDVITIGRLLFAFIDAR